MGIVETPYFCCSSCPQLTFYTLLSITFVDTNLVLVFLLLVFFHMYLVITVTPPPYSSRLYISAGSRAKRLSSCHIRSTVALARPPQKRAQTCQVLPVCLRSQVRQCMCQPLSLWTGGVSRHRYVWSSLKNIATAKDDYFTKRKKGRCKTDAWQGLNEIC